MKKKFLWNFHRKNLHKEEFLVFEPHILSGQGLSGEAVMEVTYFDLGYNPTVEFSKLQTPFPPPENIFFRKKISKNFFCAHFSSQVSIEKLF